MAARPVAGDLSGSAGILLVVAATCLAGCPHPRGTNDGGLPPDADVGDAGSNDVAAWPAIGTRWSLIRQSDPPNGARCVIVECPGCLPDDPVVMSTTVLLRASPFSGGLLLRAGTGAQVSDDPVTFSFADRLEPVEIATSREGVPLDGGTGQRFASESPFVWQLDVLQGQPSLELQQATVSGFLDADGLPTSELPPMSGTMGGCLGATSAGLVYVEVLSQTLREFLEGCRPLDCSTTAAGDADGWILEFQWQAEVVEIHEGEVI
jgi:hypothetical protein